MFRRFLVLSSILLSVMFFLAHTAQAATMTARAGSAEAQAGGTVTIPISVSGAPTVGAMHIELVYDARVLKPTGVERGELAGSNALLESNTNQAGRVVIGLVTLDGFKGDGVVANVKFEVIGNAGASSDLALERTQAWERESHAEVLVNTEAGKVTIAAGLPSWLIPALAVFALLLFLLFLFFILRRRRPAQALAPQPAYAPPSYAPPPMARPASVPPMSTRPGAPPPPMDLPERQAQPNVSANFQRAEDEYFKLKGQATMGRITHEQFEAKLRELMVQDTQGRYWMIGADTGKWYVHNGQAWVEAQPY